DPEGDDRLSWTPPEILYEPSVDGTYKSCVTAHPATLWVYTAPGVTNNRRMVVLFKAESDLNSAACTAVDADPSTCVLTGIGSMNVRFNFDGSLFAAPTPAPNLRIATPDEIIGFQSPAYLTSTGQFYLLIQKETIVIPGGPTTFALYSTTSTTGLSWSLPTLVQSPGAYSWTGNELFGQELICAANGDLVSFQGGRTWQGGGTSISEAGMGLMPSTDNGVTFTLDPTPIVSWFDDFDMRHWSVVRVGDDAYRMWVVNKDPSDNHLAIYYAQAFGAGAVVTAPVDRYCP
ncbi:MAG: hypothetical protein AAB214_12475, partial [Fibrobacterota bacterium]